MKHDKDIPENYAARPPLTLAGERTASGRVVSKRTWEEPCRKDTFFFFSGEGKNSGEQVGTVEVCGNIMRVQRQELRRVSVRDG